MTQRIRIIFLIVILASFLDPARAAPVQADSSPAPRLATAYELIDAVNSYRAQNGLPAYSINSILMGTAQAQASYNATTGVSSHTGPGGTTYSQRLTAAGYSFAFKSENHLSTSPNATGWEIVNNSWWADADHQHTMLSPNLCEVGAGVAGSGALAYYVLDAACPSGSGGSSNTAVPGATAVVIISNTPKPDGSVFHVVQPGEALWSIAIAYKTTSASISALNNLNSDLIYPGDTLLIFLASPTATPAPTATATSVPTATPFVFWTVTSPPAPTASPIPSAPVTGGSGIIIVGVIIVAALVAAGALTAAGARKRPRE